MRKYDVAYVPNGKQNYYPVKELEDMTLEEIVAKHIKTCGKANGNLATCSQCKTPCKQGKRAIQLLSNKIYNDPPIPLYGGKTLIEKAQEENMKRRQNKSAVEALSDALKEAQKPQPEKKKRQYVKWDNWWDESLNSGDQVKWLMDNMKISKTQAKKKIYMYKYNNNLLSKEKDEEKKEEKKEKIEEVKTVEKVSADSSIETKIDALLRMKDEQKKAMDEYYKLFENAKKEYEKIEKKIDTLCSAMDIMNEF